jgi:hypothetical protein
VAFQPGLPSLNLDPVSSQHIADRLPTPVDSDYDPLEDWRIFPESPTKKAKSDKEFSERVALEVQRVLLSNPQGLSMAGGQQLPTPQTSVSRAVQKFQRLVNSVPPPVDGSKWFAASTESKEIMKPGISPSHLV